MEVYKILLLANNRHYWR